MTDIVISSKADGKQLAKLEKRIEANTKAAWRENGLIMLHIRNSGLYKAGIGKPEFDESGKPIKWTFERYLEKRWDYTHQHGLRLIRTAEFMQKITHCIENDSVKTEPIGSVSAIKLPANEGQIRPLLTCLNHDGERLKVWQDVVQDGEKITASLVQRKVDEFKASGQVVEDVEIKLQSLSKGELAILESSTAAAELERIAAMREKVATSFGYPESVAAWNDWFIAEQPTDIKVVQAKRIELELAERERRMVDFPDSPEFALPSVVLADPPWRYDFAETDNRQIENQYPSATIDEIIAHRPETQPDCVLLLWGTVAKLREAFEVLDGWGFEYKTHAVWDKEKIGMGYWFRGQHELLIVATKGKMSPPEQADRVSSVFREVRGKHSAKPECVYQWIEQAFKAHTKLEMYCRAPRAGWLVFGNEAA